jgi:hypothetical protein
MFVARRHSYPIGDEEAASLAGSLHIVHLHGSLGLLPWQSGAGLGYISKTTPASILQASKSIKIIHEAVEDDPEFQKAHQLLSDAELIVFLGFWISRNQYQTAKT